VNDEELEARREDAWRDVLIAQRYGLSTNLGFIAAIAMQLAKDSAEDVEAIVRTWRHLDDRLFGRASELDLQSARIAISVLCSAIECRIDPESTEDRRDNFARELERHDREHPTPKGFPKLVLHTPSVRLNKSFSGVVLYKMAE
jgi:hypothetical protein